MNHMSCDQNSVSLLYIGDYTKILSSEEIILGNYKDSHEPISIMECRKTHGNPPIFANFLSCGTFCVLGAPGLQGMEVGFQKCLSWGPQFLLNGTRWMFPKIGVPQKWMVYNGKPYQNG